ncbi:AraC family transcriptional regulator [Pseudomonas sp. F3-2]|uniref:AraC family transcriptional regulator n=1 Tax=Pseudomonas sp. F3-2 TaxID=3141539 RepID=UPI00315DBF4E
MEKQDVHFRGGYCPIDEVSSRFHARKSDMHADPFSDLLWMMNARTVASGGLMAGGRWALDIPAPDNVKFWGVARGSCWLKIKGVRKPIHLQCGEVVLMTAAQPVIIASDLKAPRMALRDLLSSRQGAIAYLGSGEEFFMIGGNVQLAHANADLLLNALAGHVHISAESRRAPSLLWLLNRMIEEREEDMPGASAASSQLAHLLFIQILRAHLEGGGRVDPGWLKAVSDKRLAPALRLIHSDPGRTWPLETLARASAMSRAAFSAYFKSVAGISPVAYLTAWRMKLAERALREERVSLSALAQRLGYGSDSAFSNAFKRLTGVSPSHYRNAHAIDGEG